MLGDYVNRNPLLWVATLGVLLVRCVCNRGGE